MRTLKTISTILPMTLLLACGSGGGGGTAALPVALPDPEEVVDLAPLATNIEKEEEGKEIIEVSLTEPLVDEDETPAETPNVNNPAGNPGNPPDEGAGGTPPDDPPNVNNLAGNPGNPPGEKVAGTPPANPPNVNEPNNNPDNPPVVPPVVNDPFSGLVHRSFGDWDASWDDNKLAYGINPETGRFGIRGVSPAPGSLIDSSFDGAVYSGHSVVERRDGQFVNGNVRANLAQNNDGRFTIDFLFFDMNGVPDVNYTIQDYEPCAGGCRAEFSTHNYGRTRKGHFKGMQGAFSGHNNEYVSGWFGGRRIHKGVYGATRDTVEFR